MRGRDSQSSDAPPDLGDDFFEGVVAAASDAVVTADADGTVVYANPAVEDLLGYAPAEMRGRQFVEFVPERLRDRYDGWFDRYSAGDGGTPFDDDTFEVTWRAADGTETRLSISGFVHGSGDRPLFTGFLREALDRSESSERLREEEALVEEIFDTSPIALVVRDADGTLLRANERAAELVGVGAGEFPVADESERVGDGADAEGDDGRGWTVYDAEGNRLSREEYPVSRVVETGDPVYNEEVAVERPSGETVYLSVSAAPVRDDGEVRRVVGAAEDVTELKETQFELERRREELETELSEVFTRVADAFFALDDEWNVTYVNEEAERLLARSETDLVGENLWDMFPEAVGTRFQREYERAMETQEPVSFAEYYPPLSAWFDVRAYPSETGLSVYFRDVTERKARERELERYETIVETVEDGLYVMNDAMEFTMVNDALCAMTGYDRERLLGRSARTFADGIWREIADLEAELATGERSSATVEAEIERADGDTVPVEATWVLRETETGRERVGVVRDVTERKARERELQDRIRQQRAVAEFSQSALEDRDLDDLFDEAVDLVAETLDQEFAKVLKLLPEDDSLLLRAGHGWDEETIESATLDTERGSQAGYTLLSKEPVVVEDFAAEDRFAFPDLKAEKGMVSGVSTIIGSPEDPWGILETHTTERRKYPDHHVQFVQSIAHILTTAIRRRERERELERYETIVETVEDGVYALDADERFVMVNDALCEMTGYDREQLLGARASVVHSDEINERAAEMSEEVTDDLGGVTLEFELRTEDGDTIPVESRFGPYQYDEGAFARTGVVRDVTERIERERELQEQNERLDAFASMLAHELRNPLEIAQIYLDMGVENVVGEGDDASAFEEVERALDRIEEMIETLLVVTRRGGSVDTTETVTLGEKAREWWERLDPDGTLEVETNREIRADPSRLRQLLENLYRNSEEHGGPDVTVRVGDLPDGGFYVEDDGPGIPEDEREEVFDPGYSTSNVGIGFGLAVVRQLVEAHDWDVTVAESASGGARFEFTGVETPAE